MQLASMPANAERCSHSPLCLPIPIFSALCWQAQRLSLRTLPLIPVFSPFPSSSSLSTRASRMPHVIPPPCSRTHKQWNGRPHSSSTPPNPGPTTTHLHANRSASHPYSEAASTKTAHFTSRSTTKPPRQPVAAIIPLALVKVTVPSVSPATIATDVAHSPPTSLHSPALCNPQPSSSRPSPTLWPFRASATAATAANNSGLSFSCAARDLSSTLAEALDYFEPLYTTFREETKIHPHPMPTTPSSTRCG
jgi:hypothetical protein